MTSRGLGADPDLRSAPASWDVPKVCVLIVRVLVDYRVGTPPVLTICSSVTTALLRSGVPLGALSSLLQALFRQLQHLLGRFLRIQPNSAWGLAQPGDWLSLGTGMGGTCSGVNAWLAAARPPQPRCRSSAFRLSAAVRMPGARHGSRLPCTF